MDLKTYLEKKKIDYKTVDSLRISKGTKIDDVDFLENLSKLKTLEIEAVELDFENIKFPKSLESLKLKSLSITDTKIIYNLSSLQEFEMRSCHNIEEVMLPKNLKKLTLSHLRKIEYKIDSFPSGMEHIYIAYSRIKSIPVIPKTIKEFTIRNTAKLIIKDLDFTGYLNLTALELSHTNVKDLVLEKNIKRLNISHLSGIKTINLTKNIIDLKMYCSTVENVEFPLDYKFPDTAEWYIRDTPWYNRISGGDRNFRMRDYIFIKNNLKPESDERGSASIMDTGLFDFKK